MKLMIAAAAAWLLWFLQGSFWGKFWSRGLTISLSFAQPAVTEGDNAFLKEIITNNKFLPLPVLHVKFQMGRELVFTDSANSRITDQNYRNDIFSCMPWQEIRRTLEISCQKRGYYAIRQIDLVSYDLFMSNRFVSALPADTWMYVYPKAVDPVRLSLPLKNLLGQILARQALLKDPFEMQSIRPYQSFDSYRDINWKATARTGKLKVNVYGPTASWQVQLFLDVDSDLIWEDQDLTEEAIRLCGSMAKELLDQGIPVSLFTNGLDCISRKPGFLDTGAGNRHLKSIMELLSRILVDEHSISSIQALRDSEISADDSEFPSRRPMEQWLEEFSNNHSIHASFDTTVYVLISPCQRESLINAYAALCQKSPGSQWILPLRPGDTLRTVSVPKQISLFLWEVPYDHS